MFKIFSTYICWINKKMHHLEVSGAVRPLKWSLGVKWLITFDLHTKFQRPSSSCVLVVTIQPENCRNFSDDRHLGMSHNMKNILLSSFTGITTHYGFKPSQWFSSLPPFPHTTFSTLLFPLSVYLLICGFYNSHRPFLRNFMLYPNQFNKMVDNIKILPWQKLYIL